MKTIILNRNAFQGVWVELKSAGIIKITNGEMKGIRGISRNPKWCGDWDGYYWTNSSVELSEKGIELLKKYTSINLTEEEEI